MIIDINRSTGTWPFHPAPEMGSWDAVLTDMEIERITTALVSPLNTILREDPEEENLNCIERAARERGVWPVLTVNLALPNWRKMLDKCFEAAGGSGRSAKAVILFPNYHGYSLDSPEVDRLAQRLLENRLPLVLPVRIQDERLHYFRMKVPPVDFEALGRLARRHADLPIVCVNSFGREFGKIAACGENVFADISFAESLFTLEKLLDQLPAERIVYGSHYPFFTTRAATMKVVKSTLSKEIQYRILKKNAADLFRLKE